MVLKNKLLAGVYCSSSGLGFQADTTSATIANGVIGTIEILNPGSGYNVGQDYTVQVVPGTGGVGAVECIVLGNDVKDRVVAVELIDGGSGYTSEPIIVFKGGNLETYNYPFSFVEDSRIVLETKL